MPAEPCLYRISEMWHLLLPGWHRVSYTAPRMHVDQRARFDWRRAASGLIGTAVAHGCNISPAIAPTLIDFLTIPEEST
jgi:hypothetical protein